MTLKFGTSGLRGPAEELAGSASARYAAAFAAHLRAMAWLEPGGAILIGRDLRPSSPQISRSCRLAIEAAGHRPVDCGAVPTPALALAAIACRMPAMMITGSHIPADRNGIKFFRPDGEIDKTDEAAIAADAQARSDAPDDSADPLAVGAGDLNTAADAPPVLDRYRSRYRPLLARTALKGLRIGVYQHSSVARDVLVETLTDFGASVRSLGRSRRFVAVDTEAVDAETRSRLADWASTGFDAIISSDGDGDRPLVADENGTVLRGDLLGLIAAGFVGADAVVTPVTSNSGIGEALGFAVRRTRVGSPHVIAGMGEAARDGSRRIVGFEANGGVLLGSDIAGAAGTVTALPTRDALLPILAVLAASTTKAMPLSRLAADWALPATASDRLRDYPEPAAMDLLARLSSCPRERRAILRSIGTPQTVDLTDGVRIRLEGGEIIHYRASGNAPELRVYAEAASEQRASTLVAAGLERAARFAEEHERAEA